ncbi:RNA 2'-phosphotransferase [Microbacterium protaetiae]|uniref:Probable RNA 2'-phosphotransferase n=1 Tax=Microbacterium protaetiae TaxID=2509458 RepID=A0A4P6EFA2_9MICO|nr:RNA 2'-phosphotransferase [Microbacterium protaetiae]QAY59809.1 RNA 2'-phosphotransferase [Microbacterium protaetiae]
MTNDVTLSKTMSHALRHAPEEYGLLLDAAGWADLEKVREAVAKALHTPITIDDIERVVAESPKRRFESDGVSIRAAYGHSIDGRIEHPVATEAPAQLFHATAPSVLPAIRTEGLRAMGRQYVHLAVDRDVALRVGKRKASNPVLLTIEAARFRADGHPLFAAGPYIFLADGVAPEYLSEEPGAATSYG